MKKIFSCLLLVFVLCGCDIKKDVEFQRVKDVSVIEKSRKSITFLINLEFHNPNIVGGTFKAKDLEFFINDLALSQMQSDDFDVPAKENFIMPIKAKLDESTFKNRPLKLITTIVDLAISKEVNVSVKGNLDYTIVGYSDDYFIDYSQKIDLKKSN